MKFTVLWYVCTSLRYLPARWWRVRGRMWLNLASTSLSGRSRPASSAEWRLLLETYREKRSRLTLPAHTALCCKWTTRLPALFPFSVLFFLSFLLWMFSLLVLIYISASVRRTKLHSRMFVCSSVFLVFLIFIFHLFPFTGLELNSQPVDHKSDALSIICKFRP